MNDPKMKKRRELNALLSGNIKFKRPSFLKNKGYTNIKNNDPLDLEKNISSSSSLEDLYLDDKGSKKSTCFAQTCSVCLVFLLFLSLILSSTIILMHLETKQEIKNLANRFKQVEYQNIAIYKENEILRSSVNGNTTKNLSPNKFLGQGQNLNSKNILEKSITMMGSDLGRLKAEISGMKSIISSLNSKWAPVDNVPHEPIKLIPLGISRNWDQHTNANNMSSHSILQHMD